MTDPTTDAQRDTEREAWNTALASGDAERIEAERARALTAIHTRIMNEDPGYQAAGWRPTDPDAAPALIVK